MKKNPLFVAVSNQKGGVGKSTMLITLASLLNYSMGRNVAIVDCDSTQRSLFNLRERDMEMVEINKKYMVLLEEQRLRGCRIYPIRQAKPENARQVAGELAAKADFDIVFIDLPGSMDISGVLQTIFNVDYVLTPIAADNFVMDSSFVFAKSVMKCAENRNNIPLKDVFLFWTKVKKRSNTEVLDNYMALMKKQGLKILDSMIPDLCRYDKELSSRTRTYFRCSLLPPPAGQLKGSGLQELANELIVKVNEEKIRGYMVGDIPDAIENEDIIVVEVPEEGNNERQDTEKETARKNSKSCNMPKSDSNFRQKYLVNTPMPGRIQVYLNRKLYDEIKNYLNVIAPEVSIASYISNIIAEHIELNIEEITRMYKDRFSPPKIQ